MTIDDWRRELLRLMQNETNARFEVNQQRDPVAAERAYGALREAQRALTEHYAIRPEYA
jgi:hypothetical protein